MPERGRRPAITKVGTYHDDGHSVIISGWGIGCCATRCRCHINPKTNEMEVETSPTAGALGLRSFAHPDFPCKCCAPWQPEELAQIARDIRHPFFAELRHPSQAKQDDSETPSC